jgi:magnesium chelatase subunit D
VLYPFSAIVGQNLVKRALLINLICPAIGGVLLAGEKGTAKSTIVRSLPDLIPGLKVVTLPLNATEDRVMGSLHLEQAIRQGRRSFEPGLLAAAHNQILYIDEVNLLSERLVSAILDVASSGVNIVEREGISHRHPSRFVLIGSMNPEEGLLDPQLLDRFGLVVPVQGVQNPDQRAEIVRSRLAYEAGPEAFARGFMKKQARLRKALANARHAFPSVSVPEPLEELIIRINLQANAAGHRGDLVHSRAARALAALSGRAQVRDDDVEAAAPLVLYHRRRLRVGATQPASSSQQEDMPSEAGDRPVEGLEPGSREGLELDQSLQDLLEEIMGSIPEEEVFEIGATYPVRDFFGSVVDRQVRRFGSGRRNKTRTDARSGRYISYRLPGGEHHDIALDATLRAAAPFQRVRASRELAVVVRPEDIRTKVREKRIGSTILFLVDASGSMRAQRRMTAAKGAVFSLLEDAYQQRDVVGLLAFRGEGVQVLLHPTRSIELAHKRLGTLPTGGTTPLSLALVRTLEIISSLRLKDPDLIPVVVLVSDGRANISQTGQDPFEEACELAAMAAKRPVRFIVIDTEVAPVRLGLARKLSEALGAQYCQLEELNAEALTQRVRSVV